MLLRAKSQAMVIDSSTTSALKFALADVEKVAGSPVHCARTSTSKVLISPFVLQPLGLVVCMGSRILLSRRTMY